MKTTWKHGLLVAIVITIGSSCQGSFGDHRAFSRIQFIGSLGWVCGAQCYRSTDAGETWEIMVKSDTRYEYSPADRRWAFQFLDERTGYQCVNARLYRTDDGGTTWTLVNPTETLSGIFFIDKRRGLGVGTSGTQYTIDGGVTWGRSVDFQLGAVAFAGMDEIYGVAGLWLYRTSNLSGGWQEIGQFERLIWNVRVRGEHLWLVGNRGLCIRVDRRDGSLKDFSLSNGSWHHLYDIEFRAEEKIVVGTGGVIYRSSIGGNDWRRITVGSDDLMSISTSGDGAMFIAGGKEPPVFPIVEWGKPSRTILRSTTLEDWRSVRVGEK